MDIIEIAIAEIKPASYNPRKDLKPGDLEYEKLKKIIGKYDLVEPLVWNRKIGNLFGGHQRLKILVERGDERVQVVAVDLEPKDEKALNIALNKAQGDWDSPITRGGSCSSREHWSWAQKGTPRRSRRSGAAWKTTRGRSSSGHSE